MSSSPPPPPHHLDHAPPPLPHAHEEALKHEELQPSAPSPAPVLPPPPPISPAAAGMTPTQQQEQQATLIDAVVVNPAVAAAAAAAGAAADETSDSESIRLQRDISRRQSEGFVAFNKGFDACEVTPEPTNPVKKDTTTKQGRVNLSPMTPLKSIAGTSVQILKIDDLRMFCSRNGIKGSRKAKKADICWAICKAKAAYFAGHAPPYSNLIPADDARLVEEDDGVNQSIIQHSLLGDDAWGGDVVPERKRRRVDDVNGGDGGVVKSEFQFASFPGTSVPPPASDAAASGTNKKQQQSQQLQQQLISPKEEQMMLQRRLVKSREETNDAIRLHEMIESAATLRREIRAEKDRRTALWKEFVDTVGDESLATTRVKEYRAARQDSDKRTNGEVMGVKGSYETLIENVIEVDDLVKQMGMQHKALNEAIDKLLPVKEENDVSEEVKAAEDETSAARAMV